MEVIGPIADRSWPVLNRIFAVHSWLYRTTDGRIGHRASPFTPPFAVVDHVGAKSGIHRSTALVYVRDGDDIVLVASKGGYPKSPAWYFNLKANPETTVQVAREHIPVRAREATAEERPRLWELADKTWFGFKSYRARAGREIPLIVLERR